MIKSSDRKPPPRKPYFAATREGKTRVSVSLEPAIHKDLKRLAIDEDLTVEGLLKRAIQDLLVKHGYASLSLDLPRPEQPDGETR